MSQYDLLNRPVSSSATHYSHRIHDNELCTTHYFVETRLKLNIDV